MKRVVIAIDFEYDRDYADDLLDVVKVSQLSTELSGDDALTQQESLCQSDFGGEGFLNAVIDALGGAETTFRSDEN